MEFQNEGLLSTSININSMTNIDDKIMPTYFCHYNSANKYISRQTNRNAINAN